jgi:hypothetical protein
MTPICGIACATCWSSGVSADHAIDLRRGLNELGKIDRPGLILLAS